jgi:cytochrome c oxidase assembly protein subunit 15
MVAVAAGVVYLGTVTTGSGPHAGDAQALRTGLDPALTSQLHADLVFALIGLTVAQVVALAATGAPERARRAAIALLAVELCQGAVGYTQYFLGLPPLVVGLHLVGASLTVVAVVHLALATRDRGPVPTLAAPTPLPAGAATPHPRAEAGAGEPVAAGNA